MCIRDRLADRPLVQLPVVNDHPTLALDRRARLHLLGREGREGPRRRPAGQLPARNVLLDGLLQPLR
eukprot:11945158-Alexandrium_andersonii.AAC.1